MLKEQYAQVEREITFLKQD